MIKSQIKTSLAKVEFKGAIKVRTETEPDFCNKLFNMTLRAKMFFWCKLSTTFLIRSTVLQLDYRYLNTPFHFSTFLKVKQFQFQRAFQQFYVTIMRPHLLSSTQL
ncbi:Hypothetical_protein [Hexamita inflata]|uniref:Hypothetical_protein n=1 Tax=Hexamita inflata TaxID=28002 RepID=A0ABP1H4F1_9EUKA